MACVAELLQIAAARLKESSPSARLDAEILLSFVTGLSRLKLVAEPQSVIDEASQSRFLALIERRRLHEPVAYLTGTKEFYGLEFAVAPGVLIPRPETEMLVERGVGFLLERPGKLNILDLGTGSGCIAIAIARELQKRGRDFQLVAVDLSAAALEIARLNAKTHGLASQIEFLHGDWFSALPEGRIFDLIVSNPPYIAVGDLEVSPETTFEPERALYSGKDGLEAIAIILKSARKFLMPGGRLLCEFGSTQATQLLSLAGHPASDFSYRHVEVLKDLSGKDRVLAATL